MADTYVQVTNTGQTVFSLPFSSNYLLKSHVKVYKGRDLLAGTQTATLVDGTDYTFTSATQITLTTGLAAGEELTIQRQTPKDSQLSPWNDGSNLTAEALNKADLQCLYFTQEQGDLNALAATKAIASETASNTATTNVSTLTASQVNKDGSVAMTGNLQLGTNKITGVGDPTAAQDAVTKAYLERTGSIQSAQIQDGTLVNNDINNSAAIAQSKLDIADATTSASGYMSAADKTKLDGIDTGAKDDQTASEIKSLIASSPLDASHLAPNSVGDSEIVTGALDNRYYTETECDAKYFNVSTGDTIKDGDAFPDNDTTIATTAAINDRIVDLLDDVGGFVPIANETSFPNANPDVNDGAGTLISIKALSSNLTSNGSGVATIANGTVGNSTVTITGLDNSTTYAATLGMIVETTTTLNTYAFHRQVPQGTNVTTVAGSISNVNSVASNISNVNTVAGNNTNINTVSGISSNVTTVAGVASNVTTVAGISSDVTAVANDATDIGAVAAKATEIGRLGTADAVSDLNTLGTTAIVSDLDTCATNVSNINNVGGSIANVNTVATNLTSINDFADKYRIASSAPGSNNDTGDLYYNTSDNKLYIYNGSSWDVATSLSNSGGTVTGDITFTDNTKLNLGTQSDLKIFHEGPHSIIQHTNTSGYLELNTDNFRLMDDDGTLSFIKAFKGASVQLFYDSGTYSTPKFETTSTGATAHGTLRVYDGSSSIFRLETPGILAIAHTWNGTDYTIANNDGSAGHPIIFGSKTAGAESMRLDASGNAIFVGKVGIGTDSPSNNLHIASSLPTIRFEDTDVASGASYTEINASSNAGFQIYCDPTNVRSSSDFRLYIDGTNDADKQLTIDSSGATFAGDVTVQAASGEDASLYIISDDAEDWNDKTRIRKGEGDDLYIELYNGSAWEKSAQFITNGGVNLFFDGGTYSDPKLQTTAAGVTTIGTLKSAGATNQNAYIYAQPNGTAVYAEFKGYNAAGSQSAGMTTYEGSSVFIDSSNNGTVHIRSYGTGDIDLQTGGSSTLLIDDSKNATFAGVVNVNKSSAETAWTTKSLPAADSGLYVQNQNTTNGSYASLGVITKNSSSTDQSFSIVAESLAGGHRPNVYLSQRSDANEQTAAITIDSAGGVHIAYDGTAKLTTSSQGADFTIGTGEVDIYSTGSGDNASLRLLNSNATANNTVAIQLGPCNNVVGAQIRARATDDFTTTAKRDCGLELLTRLNGNFVEALDFTPEGNATFEEHIYVKGGGTANKFETTSTGAKVTGGLEVTGTIKFFDLNSPNDENVHINVQDDACTVGAYGTNGAFKVKTGSSNTLALTVDSSQNATFAGTVTCTSLTETSDIALKTNIEPITNVLDKINQITGYKYDFTKSNSSSMGVIAQDVEKVFPELVHGEEGSKSLQYSGLIGALIESVKELSAKVAALESS